MKFLAAIGVLLFAALVIVTTGCLQASAPEKPAGAGSGEAPPPHTGRELVAFVEKAYDYAKQHGREAALREFNHPNGTFIEGELYIFAYDFNGTTLALPYQPALIGTSRIDAEDANRVKFIRDLIAAAHPGSGFTSYVYPNPAHGMRPEPKLSYVMNVDGGWFLGAGTYGIANESGVILSSEVKDAIESFVRNAADSARKAGKEAALREFNDRNGSFVRGPLYVYAFDYNGTCLALPYQPQLVGTDLSGLTDRYGVSFTRIEIELARQGGGWIYYHYPNPAQNGTVEPKISYVTPVDDTWWIGAGVYPSDESAVNAVLRTAGGPGNEELQVLESVKASILANLTGADNSVAEAAEQINRTGLTGSAAKTVLASLAAEVPGAVDGLTLGPDGRLLAIRPDIYEGSVGADVSGQAHIRKLMTTRMPVLSQRFPAVEGMDGAVIGWPAADSGGVLLLFRPDVLLEQSIGPVIRGTRYSAFVLQTDGIVLYDPDPAQIGKNTYTDPMFAGYPEIMTLMDRMAREETGSGQYEFLATGTDRVVKKEAVWDTVSLHGTEWRIVVSKEVASL